MTEIGIHFQRPINEWDKAIGSFPSGVWHKVVGDQFMCRDIKHHNPGAKVVFRHLTQEDQSPLDTLAANKEKARRFFAQFIDGTFWNQKLYLGMDAIEEWNEHIIAHPDPAERKRFLLWVEAVNQVWTDEYRSTPELAHIPLVSCNTPVGNDIPVEYAAIVAAHDGIMSYHGYTHHINGSLDPGDWEWHSGRWARLDVEFRRHNIYVKWLSTEAGPYAGVYEGWRHPTVLAGDFDRYLAVVRYQIENIRAWNIAYDNRFLGAQLFTVGRTGKWDYYELDSDHIRRIGEVVASYDYPNPSPPEPPEPPEPPKPEPPQYKRVVWVIPPEAEDWQMAEVAVRAKDEGLRTLTFSHDDAGGTLQEDNTAVLFDIAPEDRPAFIEYYGELYPNTYLKWDKLPQLDIPVIRLKHGVDVSHWQGEIDWQKMSQRADVDFAFIRATNGRNVDRYFARNWAEAAARSIRRGAYHYYQNEIDPIAQADNFLRTVGDDLGELRLVGDFEDPDVPLDYASGWLIFLMELERVTGHKPVIYTSAGYWNDYARGVTWASNYPLWVANWTEASKPLLPRAWDDWHIWQYSARGEGEDYGVQSYHIDLNRANGVKALELLT